jgi:hypothetical protein
VLPASLRRYFWDQDFDRLEWPRDLEPIARRLLEAGDGPAHRWLRNTVGDDRLRAIFRKSRGRFVDARRLRYWQILLDLRPADVDAWLADPARRVWEERACR